MATATFGGTANFGKGDEASSIFDRHQINNSSSWRRRLHRYLPCIVPVIGEALGTFFLMFYVSGVSMGDYMTNGQMVLLDHAITAGLTIMTIIFALGNISGAHVNPAVTIGFASIGKFPWVQVPLYAFGQLIGGIFGTLVAKAIYDVPLDVVLTIPRVGLFKSFVVELLTSSGFMFLALSISTDDSHVSGMQAAIAVAVSIALNIVTIWPISAASMNPIRSLAPAIVAHQYKDIWIFIFAPPLGTVAGAWVHKLFGVLTNYTTINV